MADPTKFEPGYSYSGYQALNPTKPLPAPQVDNDFANVARSVNETIDAVKDIRRSDGKLANNSVGPDQLSPALNIGFTNRGLWQEGELYESGDGVFYNDVFYSARRQHVASNATRPDVALGTWLRLFSVSEIAIPDGSIATSKYRDLSVTRDKLADGAVDAAKLADGAVDAAKLQDGAFLPMKFGPVLSVPLATRQLMEGTVISPGTVSLLTSGYASVGDGGGALYLRAASEPGHMFKVRSSDGAWWELRPQANEIDLRASGVSPSSNMANAFGQAASLVPGGRVLAPFASLNLGTAVVEGHGVTLVGNGQTVLSARSLRNASLEGIIQNGVSTESAAIHPSIRVDSTFKAIQQFNANERRVYMQSATDGYLQAVMRNNVTTNAADSLANTGTDQTQYRVLALQKCVDVLTGFRASTGSGGAWSFTSLSTGVPAFTSGTYYNYDFSVDPLAYREYTLEVPSSGIIGVSLLTATNGSQNTSISVDGVNVLTGLNLRAPARRVDYEIKAVPGVRVVRITNNDDVSSRLNIAGLNFSTLREQRAGWQIDTIGVYRNSSRVDPLVIPPSSANDYAIWDLEAERWGGSYHGGEKDFTDMVLVDGISTAVGVGYLKTCRSLEFIQTSKIDWSVAGGTILDVFTRYVFSQGGYSQVTSFTGEVYARDFFTLLFGANQAYSIIDTPERKAIADIPDGTHHFLPKGSAVELSAGGADRLRIDHSFYPDNYNSPSLWRVTGPNGYHKYYSPLVKDGGKRCKNIQSVTVITA